MTKAARPEEQSSRAHGEHAISPAELLAKAPTKIARVLTHLRHFGSLNRFEAARLVGDTYLNSTTPGLENYSLPLEHLPEKSPNRWGAPCTATRYCLPTREHERADKMLALLLKRPKRAA